MSGWGGGDRVLPEFSRVPVVGSLLHTPTKPTKGQTMPRPKIPRQVARITGADVKNPKRYAGRADPVLPGVGKAPARLSPEQRATWADLVSDLPWLRRSDRTLLELACRLTTRMQTDPEMGISALAQLRLCLSSMGATPTDRSKVAMPEDNVADSASEFLQ
jgi:hypothetical protein